MEHCRYRLGLRAIGSILHTNPAPATNAILFGPVASRMGVFPGRARFWLAMLGIPLQVAVEVVRRSSRPFGRAHALLDLRPQMLRGFAADWRL